MDQQFARQTLQQTIAMIPQLQAGEQHELLELLLAQCPLVRKRPGELLLQAYRPCGRFYFCLSGLLRNFYILEDGKIFNKSFITAPGTAGPLREFVTGEPSHFFLECLEDSLLLEIPFRWLQGQIGKPSISRLYVAMLEQFALAKEAREESLLKEDATSRYLEFKQHYASLEHRIPDYHIASYLGITAVAFSRLKKTLADSDNDKLT